MATPNEYDSDFRELKRLLANYVRTESQTSERHRASVVTQIQKLETKVDHLQADIDSMKKVFFGNDAKGSVETQLALKDSQIDTLSTRIEINNKKIELLFGYKDKVFWMLLTLIGTTAMLGLSEFVAMLKAAQ